MKLVIATLPMKALGLVPPLRYPVDGNRAIEYDGAVRYPVNAVLAKTLKKDEDVTILFIAALGKYSAWEDHRKAFTEELTAINAPIGARLSFECLEIPFSQKKRDFNNLLTELTDRIPQGAQIFADITYGAKPPILSLFCALSFAEKYCGADVDYIVYGQIDFNPEQKPENPVLFDITSLYCLFNLMGMIESPDRESASKLLKDFFSV
ncbi:MAG: hypothetical protein LBK08_10455 [Treponema sp.]|jgi:hypothetical protein|nr:hypothetical protein [Treponema sp.]